MGRINIIIMILFILISCKEKADEEKVKPLFNTIEQLYDEGKYDAVIDSIRVLRNKYPKAIEARKAVLPIFQNATMKKTQLDIGKTDSLLQVAEDELKVIGNDPDLKAKAILKRDSLKIRYETLCALVRAIRMKQLK